MTLKNRIVKLESIKSNAQEDAPVYQTLRDDGTVSVRWQSGRTTVEADPMPGVKMYLGWSPDSWDGVA